ncbi:CRISPR-associated helicase/endonuclease Cas3 [Kallotenue papyrolyticum]|uniref:CRISPR-associated helicase/endonuclease Cas3 n=1 Tax=Kallotenue papyrolyticum TaxID=1325125 RepID=UPI0004AE93C6|nr:CRISPR-associated helicase/endonuclease Cas3 [Kallotenue papyrolyticum]
MSSAPPPTADTCPVWWAKWNQQRGTYHPLLCHMLDVAVVAQALWNEVAAPALRARWSETLELDDDSCGRWIAFWAGLHDLGKAAPAFQFKCTDATFRQRMAALGMPCPDSYRPIPHGIISHKLVGDLLHADWGIASRPAKQIADALGGHHGIFAPLAEVNRCAGVSVGAGAWDTQRRRLAQLLAQALDLPAEAPRSSKLPPALLMALAGLVSVADWIGSNETYFPHAASLAAEPAPLDIHAYTEQARRCADQALSRLGWKGWAPPTKPRSFAELFPFTPRPLQATVESLLPRLTGPGLVVVEAPMGEGKTEAALLLQEHWAATLGQAGAYVALPTQATSNGMFTRIYDFLTKRYPKDIVNLQLLHGHAALSSLFQVLQQHGDRLFLPGEIQADPAPDGAPPNVVAAQWFTAHKRGLLAPFGVGTIDQALLAVLATKHGFVRLYGLAAKTVIIDEVHAYDTYMSTLLERLLEWLGALGASVILLSATLPLQRRDGLLNAYARGAGWNLALTTHAAAYPRLAWLAEGDQGATSIATSPEIRRAIRLRWVDGRLPEASSSGFPLGEQLRAALSEGGCAAVICNTVRRAQQVYTALKCYFEGNAATGEGEIDLLHARLLFEARETREQRVLQRFGKGEDNRPYRAVLVATQVIEQSLDLDFDLLITDHAPADLILQRAGRLHRHQREHRPAGLQQPEVWICAPEMDANGVPRFDPGTAAVYDEHILLRSWLELHPRPQIAVPEDVAAIIEAVYDDRPPPADLSAALQTAWQTTAQRQQAARDEETQLAKECYIKAPRYDGPLSQLVGTAREEDAPELHPAHQARTRLIDYALPVICLSGTVERPILDSQPLKRSATPNVAEAKRLLQRSVTISHPGVVMALLDQPAPSGWTKSPLLRQHRLLIFDEQGRAIVGRYKLILDPERGLIIGGDDDSADL